MTVLFRWMAACAVILSAAQAVADDPPKAADFQTQVQPIFKAKCLRCHGEKKRGGELDMRTIQAMLEGGVSGPAIVPGDAEKSLLVELVHFNEMPPKKEEPRVTKEELALMRTWINGMKR